MRCFRDSSSVMQRAPELCIRSPAWRGLSSRPQEEAQPGARSLLPPLQPPLILQLRVRGPGQL